MLVRDTLEPRDQQEYAADVGLHALCISCDIANLMWSASKAGEKVRYLAWLTNRGVRTVPQAKGLAISLSNCGGHGDSEYTPRQGGPDSGPAVCCYLSRT